MSNEANIDNNVRRNGTHDMSNKCATLAAK